MMHHVLFARLTALTETWKEEENIHISETTGIVTLTFDIEYSIFIK